MTRPRAGAPGHHEPPAREGAFDAPTDDDHLRLRRARRCARALVAKIETARDIAMLAALRAEMGAVVRSASPLLISLLAIEGLTLDEAVALIRPPLHWPGYSRLSPRPVHDHLLRHYVAGARPTQLNSWPMLSHEFKHADGTYLLMRVVEHSIDFYARMAGVVLETRFGELRVELEAELPETLLVAAVGRTLEDVVDHEAWRGRGWRIVAVEDGFPPLAGQTMIVAMGSVPYLMPWAT